MKEIYQSSVKEVLGQMGSREEGLTIKEVEKSREKCGWNELAEGKKKSVLQIFLEQYKDFLVIILIIAAILWQDRPVMDQIPAESVRLEEAENTAELLSGETGGTVSAGSGSEENTAAGNKGKDLSSLLPSVSYRHRVPDVIREAAGVFHGVAVLCAVWMVNESFKLSGDWFVLAAVSCVFLLLMSWAFYLGTEEEE